MIDIQHAYGYINVYICTAMACWVASASQAVLPAGADCHGVQGAGLVQDATAARHRALHCLGCFTRRLVYPLALLTTMAYNTLDVAKTLLHYTSDELGRTFEQSRDNPFSCRRATAGRAPLATFVPCMAFLMLDLAQDTAALQERQSWAASLGTRELCRAFAQVPERVPQRG
jgi:hypothetical protein